MVCVCSGGKPEQPEQGRQRQKLQFNSRYGRSGRLTQGHKIVPAVQRYGSCG